MMSEYDRKVYGTQYLELVSLGISLHELIVNLFWTRFYTLHYSLVN